MGISSKINGFIKGVKKRFSKWTGSSAKGIQQEEQPAFKSPTFNGAAQSIMGRGLISGNTLRSISGYDEVKDDPDVRVLVGITDDLSQKIGSLAVPAKSDKVSDFLSQFTSVNAEAYEYLNHMKETFVSATTNLAGKNGKYAGFAGAIGGYAMIINQQIEFNSRLLDVVLDQVRSGSGNGVPYGRNYADLLQDKAATQIYREDESADRVAIGSGALNTVYKMNDDVAGRERVFKGGHSMANASEIESIKSRMILEGGKNTFDMHSGHRDVAVSMIDRLFGLNAVVNTSLSKSAEGNTSSMMDMAAGKTGAGTALVYDDREELAANMVNQINALGAMFENPDSMHGAVEREKPDKKKAREKSFKQVVRADSSKFVRSAYALAALDIIVGHVDRHSGNYMVTADGFKGIDNDTSFSLRDVYNEDADKRYGEGATFEELFATKDERLSIMRQKGQYITHEVGNSPVLFFNSSFPKVPREFAAQICSVTSADIRNTLKSMLLPEEIEACVNRTEKLQKYFKSLEGTDKLVDSWEQIKARDYADKHIGTIAASSKSQDASGNYMAQLTAGGMLGMLHGDKWKRIEDGSGGILSSISWMPLVEYIKKRYNVDDIPAKVISWATVDELIRTAPLDADVRSMLEQGTFDQYIWAGAGELVKHSTQPKTIRACYDIIGISSTDKEIDALAKKNKSERTA